MRIICLGMAALLLSAAGASAQYGNPYSQPRSGYGTGSNPNSVYVQPSINSRGNYTSGHYRTAPNNTTRDNYQTAPNYNPNTGLFGTRRGN